VENGRIPAGFSRHPAIFRRKVLPVLPFTAGAQAQAGAPAAGGRTRPPAPGKKLPPELPY